jgi:hypothetical protein
MEMFGGKQLEHNERCERTHEWTELLKTFWTEQGFEFDGEFYQVEKKRKLTRACVASTTSPADICDLSPSSSPDHRSSVPEPPTPSESSRRPTRT